MCVQLITVTHQSNKESKYVHIRLECVIRLRPPPRGVHAFWILAPFLFKRIFSSSSSWKNNRKWCGRRKKKLYAPQTYEMEFIESLFYIHPKTPPTGRICIINKSLGCIVKIVTYVCPFRWLAVLYDYIFLGRWKRESRAIACSVDPLIIYAPLDDSIDDLTREFLPGANRRSFPPGLKVHHPPDSLLMALYSTLVCVWSFA